MDPELSIVIPAWNEAANLPPLVRELRRTLEPLGIRYEVIVVDGGSRDGTPEVARSLDCAVVPQREPGYGGALRDGFAAARAPHVCTLDADLSHPPTFIAEMWRRRDEADLLVASRYVPGGSAEMPRSRAILSRVLNRTFGEVLAIPVRDLSSGFRMYRREALDGFRTSGRDFNVLQELLAGILARGGRVAEVPFRYRPRGAGASHARILRFGLGYLASLWHLLFLRAAIFRGEPARRLLPYILAIIFATGAAYANALANGAVRWDDDWLVFENPAIRSLAPSSLAAMFDPTAPRADYGSQYQPLSDLSYAIDGALFGWNDARRFHIQGILWHALAACALFVLANRHLRSAGIALAAALLFALHPVNVDAVTWIAGRRSAMSGALVLVAALAWMSYRRTGSPAALGGSLAAAALSCLAKQTGVATPLVLGLIELTAPRGGPAAAVPDEERRGSLLALAPHAALAVGFAAIFWWVGRREGIVGAHPLGLAGQVQSAALALAYYARMTVLPLWLRPSYGLVFGQTGLHAMVVAGALVAAAGVAALALLRRRGSAAGTFALGGAAVAVAPSITSMGTQAVAERYLYLPLAFLAVGAAAIFARAARVGPPPADLAAERALILRRRALGAALVVALAALGTATHLRNRVWRDDVTLWTDAAEKDPANRIARRLLGRALMRRSGPGDLERAEQELRAAARLEALQPPMRGPSPLPFVIGNIAELCEKRGDYAEAERLFVEAAVRIAPTSERAIVQLGDFYRRRGEIDKARAVYASHAAWDKDGKVVRERLASLERQGR